MSKLVHAFAVVGNSLRSLDFLSYPTLLVDFMRIAQRQNEDYFRLLYYSMILQNKIDINSLREMLLSLR